MKKHFFLSLRPWPSPLMVDWCDLSDDISVGSTVLCRLNPTGVLLRGSWGCGLKLSPICGVIGLEEGVSGLDGVTGLVGVIGRPSDGVDGRTGVIGRGEEEDGRVGVLERLGPGTGDILPTVLTANGSFWKRIIMNSNENQTSLKKSILCNWYFLQAFNFCYFCAPHDSAKITSFKKNIYSDKYIVWVLECVNLQ